MTEVVRYRCTRCSRTYGTFGFHGYDTQSGTGERPVVCRSCKTLLVGRFEGGQCVTSCSTCGGAPELHDGCCPSCGSDEFVFEDVRMQGFERPAVDQRDLE